MNRRSLLRFFLGSTIAAAIERFTVVGTEAKRRTCPAAFRRCKNFCLDYCYYWWGWDIGLYTACYNACRPCCTSIKHCRCGTACRQCQQSFLNTW